MKHYLDIFEEIVDSIRATGTITSIVETTLTSTITSDNSLKVKEWVKMGAKDYRIKSVTPTEFTVDGIDITATEWKALAPYFIPETPQKMVNELVAKDKNSTLKFQKYPLIWLKLNILEDEGKNGFQTVLNDPLFVIMNKSEINYSATQRKDINFVPVLNPLYYQLLEAIDESYYFHESGTSLKKQKKENYYWGTSEVVNASIVNDITDAVEMHIKELSIHQTCE